MSPHKKRRVGSLPTTVEKVQSVGGVKEYLAVWPYKKEVLHDYAGNSGKKSRRRPSHQPGHGSGIPLKKVRERES